MVPYDIFRDAGFEVTIATPGAVAPTVDPISISVKGGMLPTTAKKMEDKVEQMSHVLNNPEDLHKVDAASYDIIFYPGGHGPMEDLAYDKISGKILTDRLASGKLLGLLCHSPAALLATIDDATGQTPSRVSRLPLYPTPKKAWSRISPRPMAAGRSFEGSRLAV